MMGLCFSVTTLLILTVKWQSYLLIHILLLGFAKQTLTLASIRSVPVEVSLSSQNGQGIK